jgi:hypothetical protein
MLDPTTLPDRLKKALARKQPSPGALMPISEWMTRVITQIKSSQYSLRRKKTDTRSSAVAAG